MSHFYGTLEGNRGEATRCGSKSSGIETYAAGWKGAVRVYCYHDEKSGRDCFTVSLVPWQCSGGESRALASGFLDSTDPAPLDFRAREFLVKPEARKAA